MSNLPSREENIILEEPTITDLGMQALGPNNPLVTDLSVLIFIQVYPYECLEVSQAEMEPNPATSSRNSHIPSTTVTTGGVPPRNQPSPIWATMVSTASTLGNGSLPSLATITTPLSQSATGPPFTHGMLGFKPNVVLFHSTQPTLSLGVGSSNTPL
jgi:hypothetical protein